MEWKRLCCLRFFPLKQIISTCLLRNENDVEVVVSLGKNFEKPKDYIQVGIDAEDYYRIKNSDKEE